MNIINIFEERVFDDTSYSICSFQFTAKNDTSENISDCYIYPCNKRISFVLNNDNNYTIGGKIYNLEKNARYKIDRAAIAAIAAGAENDEFCTNILAKCIDDNINSKIGLFIVDDMTRDKYIDNTPNLTARSYAILVIKPKITLEQQEDLVKKFNMFLNEYRDKYNSLFLTNYRESNTIARKRISFGLVYDICNYLL